MKSLVKRNLVKLSLSGLCGLLLSVSALAATGDIYVISSAKVNLRNGPSDNNTVITVVERGVELIELRRDGRWLGVRILSTGDEGWIYDELVEQSVQSQLGERTESLSFKDISADFDHLLGHLGDQLGYPLVTSINQVDDNTLRVTASPAWLLRNGTDTHMMAAVAYYQVWKSSLAGAPVTLMFGDGYGGDYVVITDTDDGPKLTVDTSSLLVSKR